MHKLTLVTGLLLSLCLLVSSSILVASSSFCAGKANGVYAKADAPQTFYGCSNGITYIQNCQSGLVFDVSCMCCDWPKVTDSPPLQPTTIPSQVIPPTINATVGESSFCAGKADGLYATTGAPQSYYNCANGVTYIQDCPSGLVFDVSCNCCNYPKVPDAPPLLPTTIPSQVIPPTINATVGESSFCAGMADGLYAKTGAPQSYYGCDNDLTYIQNCPSGFVFDDSFKCCGSS